VDNIAETFVPKRFEKSQHNNGVIEISKKENIDVIIVWETASGAGGSETHCIDSK